MLLDRRVAMLPACVAALALLGVGCGGSSSNDDAPPAPTPIVTPSAGTPTSTPTPGATPGPTVSPDPRAVRLSEIASGLDQPLFVTAAPGDPGRLYVVEQTGRIRIVDASGVLPTPFVDLSQRVSCCGERGLLGLAFHPDYAENGRFFVNYTNVDGDTEVVELARSADPDVASPDPVRVFFTVEQPFANHNGGMLAFGPDGMLYVGLGDGGAAGDPRDNAQN